MKFPRVLVLPATVIALAALVANCSSSQDRASQGSLAVRVGASRPAALVQGADAASDDPIARVLAANVTIGAIEARRTDGIWLPLEGGFRAFVDLLAVARGGGAVPLPADLLPEGQYTALRVRVDQVELTLLDGARVAAAPPGTGWVAPVPADFAVVAGRETIVSLNIRLDLSLKLVGGQFEFEPEIEVQSVEHD